MQVKTDEQVRALFKDSFTVIAKSTVYARPTAPGEAIISDGFTGQVAFNDTGYVVEDDGKKTYMPGPEFHSRFEAVPDGPEGPGNARTYRCVGVLTATRYTGPAFNYRAPDGQLGTIKNESFIIDCFGKFIFLDDEQFKKGYRHV